MSTEPSTMNDENTATVDASQMRPRDGQDPLTMDHNIEHHACDLNDTTASTTRKNFRRKPPKELASGALCYSSDTDISPASTFGTTLSSGESAPVTPLTPTRDHFSQELNPSIILSSDEANDHEPNAEPRPKLLNRLVSVCSPNQNVGGVSRAQTKADSCPDRLSSMVRDLELNESSGTSDSPNSLVTQIRDSRNVSPAATPAALAQKGQETTDVADETVAVTTENAQSIYPPEASVFVANLSKDSTDEELLRDLRQIFDEFGECWVLIRRDAGTHIPFAFVQYKTKDEAQVALQEGLGKFICGRACRVEASRAHRAVYVTRKDGKEPTLDEVKSLLKDYKTSEIWTPTRTEIETYGFGNGTWVRFDLFGECKEAVKEFRNDPNYHLVYKDFNKRHKNSRARGYEGTYRPWRPRPQNPTPKRVVVSQPWGSPYLANVVPDSANVLTGNGGWYNSYPNTVSATPLPPMLSYAHATGQPVLASASTSGALPLLQHQTQTTPASGALFASHSGYALAHQPPGIFSKNNTYAITHEVPALYSQCSMSSLSPISPSYDHLFFNSQPVSPVSPHDVNGASTAFPAFHTPNFATSTQPSIAYYHTIHPTNGFAHPQGVTNAMGQQMHNVGSAQILANQQQTPYLTNTMQPLDNSSRPLTAMRANEPSPFHGQLPESFTAPPVAGYRAGVANTVPGQHELPTSPAAFGFDGTFQYYLPGQNTISPAVPAAAESITIVQATSTESHEANGTNELEEHVQQDSAEA